MTVLEMVEVVESERCTGLKMGDERRSNTGEGKKYVFSSEGLNEVVYR